MKELVKETLRRAQLLGIASLIYRAANPRSIYHNIPYWLQGAADGLPIPPLRLRSLVWGECSFTNWTERGDGSLFLEKAG
jgi:hypothetical protein